MSIVCTMRRGKTEDSSELSKRHESHQFGSWEHKHKNGMDRRVR